MYKQIALEVGDDDFSDKRWNTGMEKPQETLFERFDKRPAFYIGFGLFLYIFVNNTINATSGWMEATRNGGVPEFMLWEVFSWEYSSAISTMMLMPILFYWFKKTAVKLPYLKRFILLNLLGTLVFSALHVSIMVAIRELVYFLMGGNYDFGAVPSEFFYEYRKDAWGYLFLMSFYYVYQFIYWRLKGEATLVAEQNKSGPIETPEHLLVKKLDKEFLIKVNDIEWLEAAGNYVNLHSNGRIFPLRSTLSGLLPRLEGKGFVQIHRSYGINLGQVESIEALPAGDGEICLHNGKKLTLSRRYKEAFRQKVK